MTTLNERAQLGAEIRARFGGGTPSSGSVPGSREMAPDLHRIAIHAGWSISVGERAKSPTW